MKQHATLSPSAAYRWLACPASVRICRDLPDKTSVYAEEGTAAHAEAARALQRIYDGGPTADTLTECANLLPRFGSPEMSDHVAGYVRYVQRVAGDIADAEGAEPRVMIERRVSVNEHIFGTADALIVGRDEMAVIDLKYGAGVSVNAKDNPQMMLYALASLDPSAPDDYVIGMHIYQPRACNADAEGTPAKTAHIRARDLRAWFGRITPVIEEALGGDSEPVPGAHCRFCKANGICCAQGRRAVNARRTPPETMSAGELAAMLRAVPDIKAWCAAVEERAMEAATSAPGGLPGWEVRQGAGRRIVTDPDTLAGRLREAGVPFEDVYTLGTLTSLERAVGKRRFALLADGCVGVKPGTPKLAPAPDSRSPWDGIDLTDI